jgi:hypothetical protein
MVLRAHVRNGQIVMDEPVALPEGATLKVVVDEELDDGEPKKSGGRVLEDFEPVRPAKPIQLSDLVIEGRD